jgi:hypothetical protein
VPSYTITGVAEQVRDWNSAQGGAMKAYRIDLRGDDGTEELLVEWSRKATSPPPIVGQPVEGQIEQGQYGKKFKKAPAGGFLSGPRPEDPKRAKRIMRQHSQDMAMRALTHAFAFGLVDPPKEPKDLFALIAKTADWFDKDAEAASQ